MMFGRLGTAAVGVAGPGRLMTTTTTAVVLVVLWASGAEAGTRPAADTPRAPGVQVPEAAQGTSTTTGFPTVRHGHARGTMLAV